MTPRMLHALRKRQVEEMQRQELLVGIIASTTANYSICHPEKPISATAFMLHPLDEPRPNSSTQLTGESLMAMVRGLPAGSVNKPKNKESK